MSKAQGTISEVVEVEQLTQATDLMATLEASIAAAKSA